MRVEPLDTQTLAIKLSDNNYLGYSFDCLPISGEVDVLQVVVGDLEEFPVYVYVTETQMLCVTYLWTESEVRQEKRTEMLESMLDMNIPIPLSSFGKISERYVLYGATRRDSSFESVVTEIVTLSENAVDAISAMEEFLK